MKCGPTALAQRLYIWVRPVQLSVQFSNGNISDVTATQVQKDVL